MTTQSLGAAIDAPELEWNLPDAGAVLCYHKKGSARPLLLLHSINGAASAFEVAPFFRDMNIDRPLFAPDLPGFGRSERRDREYSPEMYADAIVEMAREIGGDGVDVVALSTTSEFAARAVLQAPELFRSLSLVSPTGFSRRRESRSPVGARILRNLQRPRLGASLFRLLRSRVSIRFFLNKAFADGAPKDMVEYAHASAAQPGARHAPFYFVSGRLFTPDAVGDLYLPLTLPVQVLYDQDPNISFDYLHEVAAEHSNWTLSRIPDTRGLPQFEKPEETLVALSAFWAALRIDPSRQD